MNEEDSLELSILVVNSAWLFWKWEEDGEPRRTPYRHGENILNSTHSNPSSGLNWKPSSCDNLNKLMFDC